MRKAAAPSQQPFPSPPVIPKGCRLQLQHPRLERRSVPSAWVGLEALSLEIPEERGACSVYSIWNYLYCFACNSSKILDRNSWARQLTSAITCLVAGVSGVYRIFPTSRGLRAFHMIRERGLDSKFFIKSLQYGAIKMKDKIFIYMVIYLWELTGLWSQ